MYEYICITACKILSCTLPFLQRDNKVILGLGYAMYIPLAKYWENNTLFLKIEIAISMHNVTIILEISTLPTTSKVTARNFRKVPKKEVLLYQDSVDRNKSPYFTYFTFINMPANKAHTIYTHSQIFVKDSLLVVQK